MTRVFNGRVLRLYFCLYSLCETGCALMDLHSKREPAQLRHAGKSAVAAGRSHQVLELCGREVIARRSKSRLSSVGVRMRSHPRNSVKRPLLLRVIHVRACGERGNCEGVRTSTSTVATRRWVPCSGSEHRRVLASVFSTSRFAPEGTLADWVG